MKKPYAVFMAAMLACMNAISSPGTPGPFYSTPPEEEIRSNLYIVGPDASTTLMDGDLTQYDQSFTNIVDGMDARKMSNFSENLGMIREATTLVIERRHTINVTDTIFYKLWNTRHILYQLEFITSNLNHPGLAGFLEDSYLHTSVAINLNGASYINFSVTADPASSAMYRFRVVFASAAAGPAPLTFTSVKAYRQNNTVRIDWKTGNERSLNVCTVEKSADGDRFSNVSDITANNLPVTNYSWIDTHPADGYNYYRIRSTEISGETKYSEVLKVFTGKPKGDIKVFPNPVTDNTIHLQIADQPEGIYEVKLINASGQCVMTNQIQHSTGTSTETIKPIQHIPQGIYQLVITGPEGSKMNIHLIF